MRVRFRDTDAQGHVYFANYLVFCDEAWGAYMRHIGLPYQDLARHGVDTFYVNARCDYQGSAKYEDDLHIETHVTRIGTSSITTEFTVRNDHGDTLATASLTSVCVDPTTREPTQVPVAFLDRVSAQEGAHPSSAKRSSA